jgi:feruloyl esterase
VTSYTGLNIGSDYAGILGLGTQAAFPVPPKPSVLGLMHGYADAIIRNFILRDPTANTLNFDPLNPGVYAARIQDVSNFLDSNTVEIQPFMKKGKWILVHGLSDQLIAPGASVDYYNRLVTKFGQAEVSRFMRFYTVPGYGHGSGPFNASGGLPTLDALEQWVESGMAPGELVVKDTNAGLSTTNRTRPLCEYPKWPRYSGSGDVNSASSYVCASN